MVLSEAALGSEEGGLFLGEMSHPRARPESRLRAPSSYLAVLRGNNQSRNRGLLLLQKQRDWKETEIY